MSRQFFSNLITNAIHSKKYPAINLKEAYKPTYLVTWRGFNTKYLEVMLETDLNFHTLHKNHISVKVKIHWVLTTRVYPYIDILSADQVCKVIKLNLGVTMVKPILYQYIM